MAWAVRWSSCLLLFFLFNSAICADHSCTYSRATLQYYAVSSRYSRSCGFYSWDRCVFTRYHRRSRYITTYYKDCCVGWRKSSSGLCDDPICGRECQHGGTCYWPYTCQCIDQYYGERDQCQHRCPLISNCVLEKCTSPSDNICSECQSRQGPTEIAFELDPQKKSCLSRCSWLNNWCWPGYCTGTSTSADSCTCAPGYSSPPKCDTVTDKPTIVLADTSVEDDHSHFANFSYLHGKAPHPLTFTNLAPVKVSVSTTGTFIGPKIGSGTFTSTRFLTDYRNYTKPPWIRDYELGVASVRFKVWAQTSAGVRRDLADQPLQCTSAGVVANISNANPKSPVDCSSSFSLKGVIFVDNERLFVEVNVENGGLVTIYDYDSKMLTNHNYTGATASTTAQFKFDKAPPIHCSTDNRVSCDSGVTADDMLSVGPYLVRNCHIQAWWKGWIDSPGGAGIDAYFLDVYKVVAKGLTHLGEKTSSVSHFAYANNASQQDFDLPTEGLYSVVLTVRDYTGNTRRARRLILFVKNSSADICPMHRGPPGLPGERGPAGRSGKDGERGPKGDSAKNNSSIYLLITPNDVKYKRYGDRVRLHETLSDGASISFDAGSTANNRLMSVTLVEPDVLDDSARYIVTATIAHRSPVSVTTDMDVYVTVSDGVGAVGYLIFDKRNRNAKNTMWPCEGARGQAFVNHVTGCTKLKSSSVTNFSPLHTVQVKFGGHHEAFGIGKTVSEIFTHNFLNVLKPSRGIFLDIYRHDAAERYIIDFIEVRLEKEN